MGVIHVYLLLTVTITVVCPCCTERRQLLPAVISGPTDTSPVNTCPTWFIRNGHGHCECKAAPGVICGSDTALLQAGYCVWYDSESEYVQVAECPFSYTLQESDYLNNAYIKLPSNVSDINGHFCNNLRRNSTLCSRCLPGLGQPVFSYSFRCIRCLPSSYGWFAFISVVCFPSTLLFLVVIIFQIHATSPQLNFFIFGAQYISFIAHFYPQANMTSLGKALESFYSIWNLDYFRYIMPPFCVSEKHSLLHTHAAEYLVALYPLLLIVLTYFCIELHARGNTVIVALWRPFRVCFTRVRRRWDPRGSIIHAFATFLLLSYSKLLHTSYFLLDGVFLFNNNGERIGGLRTYIDSSVSYYGAEHRPFVFLASFIVLFVIVLPPLFLCLYPTRIFQKCLHIGCLKCNGLRVFAEVFNGCFKDGTDNCLDCRFFGGFYLTVRVSLFIAAFLTPWQYAHLIAACTLIVVLFLLVLFQPYKDNVFNIVDGFFFSLMLLCTITDLYRKFISDIPPSFYYVTFTAPLIYFIILVTCKILVQTCLLDSQSQQCPGVKNLVRRFAGYQHNMHHQELLQDDIPHRLLSPREYIQP